MLGTAAPRRSLPAGAASAPSRRRFRPHGDVHVTVIGGGVSGAFIAADLAAAGFKVTVVEKKYIGNGASSRSAACIRAQFDVEDSVVAMMYAEHFFRNFTQLLPTSSIYRRPVLTANGYLFLHERPEVLDAVRAQEATIEWTRAQDAARMQQGLGLRVDILDASEVARRWPYISGGRVRGATWGPDDGYLDADLVYRHVFEHAQKLGARLVQKWDVCGAKKEGHRIVALLNSSGDEIPADIVINATNAWAPRVSEALGGMTLPIEPIKRHLYTLRPYNEIMSADEWRAMPMVIWGSTSNRRAYSRPQGAQLLIGWAHNTQADRLFDDVDQDIAEPGCRHSDPDSLGHRALMEIEAFAPHLANCGGIASTHSGYYDVTPDHNPLIGFDSRIENLVHAAGFSGHGFMMAPITGHIVNVLVTGRYDERGLFSLPEPFQRFQLDLATFDPIWDRRCSRPERRVI